MRLLYFSRDYTPHDHRFLAALAETEHQVYYLRLERGSRPTEERSIPSSIEQIPWRGGQGVFKWTDLPRLLWDLKRVIRSVKPDLIHAGPIQTCGLLTALTGLRPLLTMSWGYDLMQDAERNESWRGITRYVLRNTTVLASDCETIRQKAIDFGMNPNHTVVFPWGVDLEHFTPAATRRSSSDFTLLCNRAWEPIYGVDVLARAFVKAAHQCPKLRLMLLGGGSQGNMLRQILADGNVMERVHFGGQVSQLELPRYYQMADLYVSASHIDGSSVSLMEALASGLPALASDIPANKEWVSEGINGWLFPDGDVDALASGILRAYSERKDMKSISRAARRTAEKKADWKENFQKLLEAYDMAVKVAG